MRVLSIGRRAVAGLVVVLASGLAPGLAPGGAAAADVHVLTSGGLTAAYRILGPEFERATGHRLITAQGASMGQAPDAIPQRLARGEPADVLLLAAGGLDALIAGGKAVPGSRVDIAESLIGLAVRSGAPRPDISTMEGFRRALLAAKSIAYSASASGVYIEAEMYRRMGLEAELAPKSRKILSERVGSVVARGEAEIGFQQMSELLPIQGIDTIGPIPREVQQVTVFSAGIAANAAQPAAARALIAFLASPEAREALRKTGVEPMGAQSPASPLSTSPAR
ncbi:substrate-binding domain-containing protein [Paeniroseomonas aquatica]|uniref:Substrate-binding domain-containing protein n=1 Tax=Paeniroseomonas aquatica TaxID=373043 RepID=A0ABT8AAN7_9PROT|nr:substrate-binding domain-containing protein [Paeniroseomonas aquatica]MDN3566805.1 substrate-binding domain-containing protein [Paeniroseomonas aquatica]